MLTRTVPMRARAPKGRPMGTIVFTLAAALTVKTCSLSSHSSSLSAFLVAQAPGAQGCQRAAQAQQFRAS